ncbi:AraC family transcriptional regulator [Fodinisporobacter ferrooxydans]|uniref:AraC family transcriptional regulator n=1 Tax=Fodinisporobacter ferrooxydans TaxID=2901836 RepID=A0ABY4CGI1_9BACL|nr:AraC family transcriptional regulator [Alicyclobacillaceae bacterium MYW30-H2]
MANTTLDTNKPIFFPGQRYFREGESFFMNYFWENGNTPFHKHDFFELTYVKEGHGYHRIGELTYKVTRGDLFIINHSIPHVFMPETPHSPLLVINCVVKPEFIDEDMSSVHDFQDLFMYNLFQSFVPGYNSYDADVHWQVHERSEIERLLAEMYEEYTQQKKGYLTVLRGHVLHLLIAILRKMDDKYKTQSKQYDENTRSEIQTVLKRIERDFQKDLRIEDLARAAFISKSYLSRLFKETTGLTIIEYIQTIRIEKSIELLQSTHWTIAQIAEFVGYADIKHFTNLFKKITGKSPTQVRGIHSNQNP